jgi:hypothetical protein
MITVKCRCGFVLGKFESGRRHGNVTMLCLSCGRRMGIYNNALRQREQNPGDFDDPTVVEAELEAEAERQPLANVLNRRGFRPDVSTGRVVALMTEDDEKVDDSVLRILELDPANLGYLDAHPEGSDRGGYVPFVFRGEESAYWDEMELWRS